MVFNATFNNISAISWWSVLLVEEIRVLNFLVPYDRLLVFPRYYRFLHQ